VAVRKKKLSLASLAGDLNPLDDLSQLVVRLRKETRESRFVEWKSHPPLGPTVSTRNKYRVVRTAIAFANADGGFILFGVDPGGKWSGLVAKELEQVDPAHVIELVNGCIYPEIQSLNFADFSHGGSSFAVLHIPPSPIAPHVTTKEIQDKDEAGKYRTTLAKHAVYYRQGAKSDLATAHQHQRLINRRIDHLRDDLVRRVKEITVPVSGVGVGQARIGSTSMTVARLSKDPNAPAIRLTRSKEGATGVFLHEELSDGLFEEINNVIDANTLLSKGQAIPHFHLGESIYYRIYAERHHVELADYRSALLLRTGLVDNYFPCLFWCLHLSVEEVVALMKAGAEDQREPQIHGLVRLVTLLGTRASDWLWDSLEKRWSKYTQRPDIYWSFKEQRSRSWPDRRLEALRITGKTTIRIPGQPETTVDRLLIDPTTASNQLTKCCLEIFGGNKELRTTARQLDVLTYGADIAEKADDFGKLLLV
jgi:schlafen family protein